ncbi:MAG: glutathione S-transferase family protein [Alphaproteobacteria bacterium]|nr:glutathione S-transferase family protein [Alphaproteobacteria bacterium]
MGYVLIGTEASYFTGKVRSYLRWKGVDFVETVATPEVYRDIIEPRVGYAVIPVLLTPGGQTIQDTAVIIDHVEAEAPGPSVYPAGAVQRLVTLLIQLYADEWLVIPAMHYRWNYNEDWVGAEFGQTAAPAAKKDEQKRIGKIIGDRFRSFVPKLGVSEDTISGIEAHYEGFLADFSAHLRSMPFLLGSRACLADFALFGPLYAHLYRDPGSGELMSRLAPLVADWVERMLTIGPGAGEFAPGDETPSTLLPILKRQMSEQLPVLIDAARKLADWAVVQPKGARVPRQLGEHEFTIGGRRGERSIITFSLWRLQAVMDHYQTLRGEDRRGADDLFDAVGGGELITMAPPRRLERRDFRLVLA